MQTSRSVVVACLCAALVSGCGDNGSREVEGDTALSVCDEPLVGRVNLPADDALHGEETEWWYWTGHLETASGRYFGFESAFFAVSAEGNSGQMVNHAITDLEDDSFHHMASIIERPATFVADGVDLDVGGQRVVAGNGHDVLHGEVDGYVLDLVMDAVKRPVFHHVDGYTDYTFGGFTYYYSRERMTTTGTLTLPDGDVLEVHGTSWFDHQWGALSKAVGIGWDWFALQLDDDREVMLFQIRDPSGEVFVEGSLTDAECNTWELLQDDIEIIANSTWTSPHGGAVYPSSWTVRILDETFEITPMMADQEVDTIFFKYWEGAAVVSGAATGRAYVELTGY